MGSLDGRERKDCGRDCFFLEQHCRSSSGHLRQRSRKSGKSGGMSVLNRALPSRIAGLHELASNLWWSWNPSAREVFRMLDYSTWRLTDHNPLKMLSLLSAERLEEAACDPNF